MTRKAMTLMALVLLGATFATAAVALACPAPRCHQKAAQDCTLFRQLDPSTCRGAVARQVIDSNRAASRAILRLKMLPPPGRQRPNLPLVPHR